MQVQKEVEEKFRDYGEVCRADCKLRIKLIIVMLLLKE